MKTRTISRMFGSMFLPLVFLMALSAGALFFVRYADACSLMMKTNKYGTFVGRTMEWWGPLDTKIIIIPRGFHDHSVNDAMKWTVKYGTVAVQDHEFRGEAVIAEGVNEKGLTAHILWQQDDDIPAPVRGKPELSVFSWVKYVLAMYANVDEVVKGLNGYQLVAAEVPYEGQHIMPHFHFAVNDAGGDAAIIEFNGGKIQVFHGSQYNVMTNEPKLPDQLANLEKIKQENKLYSVARLPGGAEPSNRFVRNSFNMENMPEPKSASQAVAYMEEAIAGVMVPAFDDRKHPVSPLSDAWEARWHVVYDLKNMRMYFDQDETGKRLYMKIKDVDFTGKTVRQIFPDNIKSAYDL